FLIAPARSGFWRSIAFVERLVKNLRMILNRESQPIVGLRSAPFRNLPRKTRSAKRTTTIPTAISGTKSHHMAPDGTRLPSGCAAKPPDDDHDEGDGEPDPEAQSVGGERRGRGGVGVHHGTVPERDERALPEV